MTLKASGNVYSIKNFHGDTALTVSDNGVPTSSVYLYDPFGQTVPSAAFGTGGYGGSSKDPSNSSNQAMAWAASPVRKAEASDLFSIPIIQMGARVYLPTLGRFLQVDPIEGGGANSYSYPTDPINASDYTGKLWGWLQKTVDWTKKNINNIKGTALAVTATATVAVAPLAGPYAGAIVVLGAAQYGASAKYFAQGQGATPQQAQSYGLKTFTGMSMVGARSGLAVPSTTIQGGQTIPSTAKRVWNQYDANNYHSLGAGYKVAPYNNSNGALPTNTTYTEYYIYPRPIQGSERFVQGGNGSIYYTPDHYETFIQW